MSAKGIATPLELSMLRLILLGADPYGGKLGGSRKVSQALARCRRKNLLTKKQNSDSESVDVVEPLGLQVLGVPLGRGGAIVSDPKTALFVADFGWGHIKDHWQRCDECDGTGKYDGDECSACNGERKLRWGSFYVEDTGLCTHCGEDEASVSQMYEESSSCSGGWVCLTCYVEHHQQKCGCNRWRKAEAALPKAEVAS